jgi:hypothetical protein
LSVATGIGPRELLTLDGDMFGAVVRAAARAQGIEVEPGEPERVSVARLADIGGAGVERVGVSQP